MDRLPKKRRRKPSSTGVYLTIPTGLKPEDLPPQFKKKPSLAYYVLHQILENRCRWRHGESNYVPVNQTHLRRFIHPRYRVLPSLLEAGILETDGKFRPGEKSLGYRLAPEYGEELTEIECEDQILSRKIRQHRIRVVAKPVRPEALEPVHTYLLSWMYQTTIDHRAALEAIREAGKSPECRMAIDTIHRGEWDVVICEQGRFHTPITRLVREARGFLRIHDQKLVSLDLRNSQPVFLSLLMPPEPQGSGPIPEPENRLPLLRREPAPPHTLCCTNSAFSSLVLSGQLYDYLRVKAGLSRDELKEQLFRYVLYGKPLPWIVEHPVARLFQKEFPEVWSLIQEQKAGDHSFLACLLQRMESGFFIGGVCQRLMTEAPEVPILTIHDSILTTSSNVDLVKGIILDEFQKQWGVVPTLKVSA